MMGADASVNAVPMANAAAMRPVQPPPEQRVVESSAKGTLQQQTGSTLAPPPSAVDRLVDSARQFAEVLDQTGNVYVASSVSGFRVGQLDTYA